MVKAFVAVGVCAQALSSVFARGEFEFTVLNPECCAGGAGLCVVMRTPEGRDCRHWRLAVNVRSGGEREASVLERYQRAANDAKAYLAKGDETLLVSAEAGVTLMNDCSGVCDHNPKGWA